MPCSTYRLQLLPWSSLDDAADLVPYLDALGVTHLYLSPLLEAAPESTHGYDVVDPGRVSERLGGEAALERLAEAAASVGMGLVVDIVPNHMSSEVPANTRLDEALAAGEASPSFAFFDFDRDADPDGRILLPTLGDHYGALVDRGALRLDRGPDGIVATDGHNRWPIDPTTIGGDLDAATGPGGRNDSVDPDDPAELGALNALNAEPDRVHAVLERQAYRLAHWQLAAERIGYRRFFDITGLIGVRVDDPEVFDAVHARTIDHARRGLIDGIRVDHPDGLRRPTTYFRALRAAAPSAWIVAEKIVEHGESLPESWPVDGTTGYEYLDVLTGLFVDPAAAEPLTATHRDLTGENRTFAEIATEAKRRVLDAVLGAELNRVLRHVAAACHRRRFYRDLTDADRRSAIVETLVAFDVYRTYVDENGAADPTDIDRIDAAIAAARRTAPATDPRAFDLLGQLLRGDGATDGAESPDDVEVRMRFQQLSGPVMAKAVEDTASYRYARLVARNEVGGDPDRLSVDVDGFDTACRDVVDRWPATMITTSTHDTKRGEDVRLRLAVLSELADRWDDLARTWLPRHLADHPIVPDLGLLLYQTAIGAHPIERDRLQAYAIKAAREAKRATRWTEPDDDYEAAITGFVDALYDPDGFAPELDRLAAELAGPWATTSLAHKLLALTMPGVPDLYQGSEGWDLRLVDPDNRGPVDFATLRARRDTLDGMEPAAIWRLQDREPAKQWVCQQALRLRRARPEAFGPRGGYRRLAVAGPAADHLVAFARGDDDAVVLAPRLVVGLDRAGGWRDTTVELPAGGFRDELTGAGHDGGRRLVAELLTVAPLALLVPDRTG